MVINFDNYGLYYDPNKIKIYLDGELQTQATAFDVEEGWADVYETLVQGQEPTITRLVGVVTVEGKWQEE